MTKIDSKLLGLIRDIRIGINFSEKELKKANKYIDKNLAFYLTDFIPVTNYPYSESINIEEIKAKMIKKYPEAERIPDELMEKVIGDIKEVKTCGEAKEKFYYIPEGRDYSKVVRSRNP